jgi:hypothetical protein
VLIIQGFAENFTFVHCAHRLAIVMPIQKLVILVQVYASSKFAMKTQTALKWQIIAILTLSNANNKPVQKTKIVVQRCAMDHCANIAT